MSTLRNVTNDGGGPGSPIADGPARFVVTGPTGWIGQALLSRLHAAFGDALAERTILFGSSGRRLDGPFGSLEVLPLSAIRAAHLDDAILYHLAYVTRDRLDGVGDGAFAQANIGIDDLVLAALHGAAPRGVFVASSGAASEVTAGTSSDLYGMLKLRQETRFAEMAAARGGALFNARIFNIAGPHVNKRDIYALASFLSQGIDTGRIAIRAAIPVFRAYVHVLDMIDLSLASLLAGEVHAAPVEVAGTQIVEMAEVAEAAARALSLDPAVVSRPPVDTARSSIYVGAPYAFNALAMRHGLRLRSFDEQVRDTAAFLMGNPARSSTTGG